MFGCRRGDFRPPSQATAASSAAGPGMTVAVPERTAPTPPWRPPTDPLPLTATQPVSLCYHGNFSLSLVDNDSDVSDDVVDADSIRSILELAGKRTLHKPIVTVVFYAL